MKDYPLISIMMPVYNGLPFIKASIKSVFNQSYTNWECIIVDDGSTDGTSDYLDSIDDTRFRIIHLKKNSGRAIARQIALDEAKGMYIAMLDADDLMHPKRLELQFNEFKNNPDIALVGALMCSFGTRTNILRVRGNFNGVISFNGIEVPTHAPCMLKTELAKQYSYNPILNMGEDVDFLKHYLKGRKYVVLPRILYYYSEFDSVTKKKILNSYKYIIRNKHYSITYRTCVLCKYMFALLLYPFISIDDILKRRGKTLSTVEETECRMFCKSMLNDVL